MSGKPKNETLGKLWDVIHDRPLQPSFLPVLQVLRHMHSDTKVRRLPSYTHSRSSWTCRGLPHPHPIPSADRVSFAS